MSAPRKKRAATKKRAKKRRAPRTFWIVLDRGKHHLTHPTKACAAAELALIGGSDPDARIVGPYVLAERVCER